MLKPLTRSPASFTNAAATISGMKRSPFVWLGLYSGGAQRALSTDACRGAQRRQGRAGATGGVAQPLGRAAVGRGPGRAQGRQQRVQLPLDVDQRLAAAAQRRR